MSNVHRLRVTDCIFFVTVNLRPRIKRGNESENDLLLAVLEASRRRLGFLLCRYVLMPEPWHALIWPSYPLRIDQVLNDGKEKVATVSDFLTVGTSVGDGEVGTAIGEQVARAWNLTYRGTIPAHAIQYRRVVLLSSFEQEK